jgi:gliding motility-associated-like protein
VKWSYDSSNVYWVCQIATNATGCSDTICKPVTVDLFIYMANVFTPGNADGKNDTYRVPIQGQDLYDMRIFNRWGEKVFTSQDAKIQWNGTVNNTGADCPEGTYFYQFTYRFKGKKEKMVSGSVNLIRGQ